MAVPETQADTPPPAASRRLWPRGWRARFGLGGAAVALAAGSVAWFDRERIAGDFIDDYLVQSGVPATYDIIAIGPRAQVIENLVIGDPARPDFTARRMVVELGVGWAGPEVRRVRLDGARLFGSYRGGELSFGALDPLVFTDSTAPPALPGIDMTITDARALLESDYGDVGVKLDGEGRLDDGFAGKLAATTRGIGTPTCRADAATLYGTITTSAGAPRLAGPLRMSGLDCGGARLTQADVGTELTLARDFGRAEGDFALEGTGLAYADYSGATLTGTGKLAWSGTGLVLAHDLGITDVATPQGRIARFAAEGTWKSGSDAARGTWQGRLQGEGLAADAALGRSLASAERGLEGTLLAPLIAKVRGGLAEALGGASFSAEALVRHKPGEAALVIPEAALTSRAGERVAALSQVNVALADGALAGLRGNVLIGGAGLPNINGRMEQGGGGWALRMTMAEYSAGANRVEVPRLTLRQERGGSLRFDGTVRASGDLPGGAISGLDLPIEGRWSAARGLALGTRCTALRFGSLALSGMALEGQGMTLCPEGDAPLLAYDDTLRLAARSGPVELAGTLGESPAWLSARSLALRYPAPFEVEGLSARLGAPGSEARLSAASLTGSLAGDIGGSFTGGSAALDLVPLDLGAITGQWSFADGVLRVEEGAFMLTDRPAEGPERFAPLLARGAVLSLADNALTATASLRHPASGREVARIAIDHDLASAAGGASLTVPGLAFDPALQPEDLSYLAQDIIVFAEGTVSGTGRIDWVGDTITSSGTFGSDGLAFAAPFGPVRGLKGDVRFTDLLNLTTAPDQELTIAAINPGVEVLAGKVRFDLKDGVLLSLKDARFPFMGGNLIMRPLEMDFSQPEERRYVFEIIGLDAATFVAEMELTNLSATGTFDGTVPIVFDKDGNGRIEGGVLLSRTGGGNVAYVGELTYEDLGTMGNYAFSALRSLDYRQMSVGLNGNLAGEIITSFQFDGIGQGEGASSNFVTRRLAKLPIRFKINVRSENFYQLATMVRSFWDVDYLGNPVDRGLLRSEGGRFVPANPVAPSGKPVQPPESEDQP
ncbi:YdbH domain-containing protein [Erythrobacter sp.]|uniref:intermembrane phospholipid transport protein YdbH family protein n=1 Tax=Erythrobacter sp. TaxID=1042 RepID=UPI0025E83298|nr:YdbH domain-containing protein [Erythrobacter sp.]